MIEKDFVLPEADRAGRLSSGLPAIQVSHVGKQFGQTKVLRDVDFTLERGKVYSILGPSGEGKSTLLKVMIGATPPSTGGVKIDGIDIWDSNTHERNRARRKFGVLFQSGALLNNLTCGENVALPLRQHTELDESTIQMMVKMKLELVGMGHARDRKPAQLSGGMIKRCALARAIALDPAIVFFDEPSAGIDPVMIAVLDRLILDLTEKLGITSVVITHEMPSAFRISDEMLMLFRGKVHFRGTPEEFRDSNDDAVKQFIHGAADGPISQAQGRGDLARKILGIQDQALKDSRHMSLVDYAKEMPAKKESPASRKFNEAHKTLMGITMSQRKEARATLNEVREKETRVIQKDESDGERTNSQPKNPSVEEVEEENS